MLGLRCRFVSGHERTRTRQRDGVFDPRRHLLGRLRGRLRLHDRLAHVPLAHFETLAVLGEIDVDMLLVIAVRTGTQHGRKARAGACPQSLPPGFCDLDVRQGEHPSVRHSEIADIEGIGATMLAQSGRREFDFGCGIRTNPDCRSCAASRASMAFAARATSSRTHRATCSAIVQRSVAGGTTATLVLSNRITLCSITTSAATQSPAAAIGGSGLELRELRQSDLAGGSERAATAIKHIAPQHFPPCQEARRGQ